MRDRGRALFIAALTAACFVLAACGGDDSKAERKSRDGKATAAATIAAAPREATAGSGAAGSPASPAGRTSNAIPVDCGRDLKTFRFDGRLSLETPRDGASSGAPSATVGSLLENVKFRGAYVSPDRTQLQFEFSGAGSPLTGQVVEFVQIGTAWYYRLGNSGWQKQEGAGPNPAEALNPKELCKELEQGLSANVPTRKERVNGVDATRYEYDRNNLERMGGFIGALSGAQELPENTKMNVWVSEKEKFPVKMTLTGSSEQAGQRFAMDLEFNVTDLNASGIRVEVPR